MSWIVLELTMRGEQDDPDTVAASIAKALKLTPSDVYIPVAVTQVGTDRVFQHLYEGYAFAKYSRSPTDYFRLENTKYVQSVLLKVGSGTKASRISSVSDSDILKMQDRVKQYADQGIGVGDTVRILSGPYRNIQAEVLVDMPETKTVQVFVKLRSKQTLLNLPRSFLVVEKRAPYSRLENRIADLGSWVTKVAPIFELREEDSRPVVQAFSQFEKLVRFSEGADTLIDIVLDSRMDLKLKSVYKTLAKFEVTSSLYNRFNDLRSYINLYDSAVIGDNAQDLVDKLLDLMWLDDLLKRVSHLWLDVSAIARDVLIEGKDKNTVVNNLVIDGHNLALRCFHAPGMSKLTDSQGRPTGMILGFLRSLGSLKKRFPEAAIYVTWDGSSQRRRQKFGEYKANRNGPVTDMRMLRDILSCLGVYQVWNPAEEADDVIATLVRGPLVGQSNLIVSSDKDFLQLVTDTTKLLYPAIGSRNEVLYDYAAVVEYMGVPPEKVVQLRALYGDASDNIPAVPRVPKKILRQLIQTHGSVAGIYQTGLAELSKGQYERLMSAEPQVRINVDLMTLLDVDVQTQIPNVDIDELVAKLRDLDIDPTSHVATFFGRLVDE